MSNQGGRTRGVTCLTPLKDLETSSPLAAESTERSFREFDERIRGCSVH